MPFVPVAPPAPLPVMGPVAAVSVDAVRRRVFALGARSLAVIDADTGRLVATIRIGGARSMALEPLGGHVFVGTADGRISEIDPDRKTIVRSAPAGAPVDVVVYDAMSGRLYLAGGAVPALTVLDAASLKPESPIPFPGIPGSIAPDPVTHELYIAERAASVATVDPQRGTIRATFSTPGLPGNSIVRFDDALGQIAVAGTNGTLDIYDRAGTQRWRIAIPESMGACDSDTSSHVVECTGPHGLTFVQLRREAEPLVLGTVPFAGPASAAFDAKTHNVVALRSNADGSGMNMQHFHAVDGR